MYEATAGLPFLNQTYCYNIFTLFNLHYYHKVLHHCVRVENLNSYLNYQSAISTLLAMTKYSINSSYL